MKKIIFFFLSVFVSALSCAQENKEIVVFATIVNGDTIPLVPLKEITISSCQIVKNEREIRYTRRLIRNVKKVYPYAKLAGIKLKEYNHLLAQAPNPHVRGKIMKQAEKELKDEFEGDLRKLTISQGKILIKLIDRETGNSSYELVKDLRGGFTAFFYQTFARLFGYNLKIKYEPLGKDRSIEIIVKMIENGSI